MFQLKKIFALLVVFCVVFAGLSGTALAAKALRWKIATLAPKELGWSQQTRALVMPYVRDATDDQLRLKVYYGGVMGNDEEYLAKMRIGQLQGAGVTAKGSNEACPELTVLGLPFLFNGYDEVDYIRDVMFPTFDYYFAENGYKLFMWFDQDFDQLYSSKYKMNKIADFQKARFQSWYGPLEEEMVKAMGGSPIPMPPTEAPASYRTGAIDANFAPALFMVGSQMYTSVKYMNTEPVRYAPAIVLTTLEAWETLPELWKENLDAGRGAVMEKFNDGIRKDNRRCIEGMINYGVTKVDVDPVDWGEVRNRAMTVYESLADKVYPMDLLLEVQKHLGAFRKGQKRRTPAPVLVTKPLPKPKPVTVAKVEAPKPVPAPPKPAPKPVAPKVEAPKVEAPKPVQLPEPPPAPVKVEPVPDLAKIAEAYKPAMEAEKKAAAKPKVDKPKPATPKVSSWEKRRRRITEVQKVLKPMGLYNFKIDGLFGPITRKGIMEYQKMYGLPVTGAVDKALLGHMGIKD